ncbi:MAG: hypothetical protein JJU10_05445 [Idiomarina sp.]|nr:hypothetical protein [Idiomarina sp.]
MPNFPIEFVNEQLELDSNTPELRTESETLVENIRDSSHHRFEIRLRSWPLTKPEHRRVFGLLHDFIGGVPFDLVLPGYTDKPLGVAGGSPAVRTAAPAGQKFLQLKQCASNVIGQHKAGDYFQIAGRTKLYILTKDANTNGSGETTIYFRPGLKEAVSVDTLLKVRDCAGRFVMRPDVLKFRVRGNDKEITRLEIDAYEDLR